MRFSLVHEPGTLTIAKHTNPVHLPSPSTRTRYTYHRQAHEPGTLTIAKHTNPVHLRSPSTRTWYTYHRQAHEPGTLTIAKHTNPVHLPSPSTRTRYTYHRQAHEPGTLTIAKHTNLVHLPSPSTRTWYTYHRQAHEPGTLTIAKQICDLGMRRRISVNYMTKLEVLSVIRNGRPFQSFSSIRVWKLSFRATAKVYNLLIRGTCVPELQWKFLVLVSNWNSRLSSRRVLVKQYERQTPFDQQQRCAIRIPFSPSPGKGSGTSRYQSAALTETLWWSHRWQTLDIPIPRAGT